MVTKPTPFVLVVEPDPIVLVEIRTILETAGLRTAGARTTSEALELVRAGEFDAAILRVSDDEPDAIQRVRSEDPNLGIVVVAASPERDSRHDHDGLDVYAVCSRSCVPTEIVQNTTEAVEFSRLMRERGAAIEAALSDRLRKLEQAQK